MRFGDQNSCAQDFGWLFTLPPTCTEVEVSFHHGSRNVRFHVTSMEVLGYQLEWKSESHGASMHVHALPWKEVDAIQLPWKEFNRPKLTWKYMEVEKFV